MPQLSYMSTNSIPGNPSGKGTFGWLWGKTRSIGTRRSTSSHGPMTRPTPEIELFTLPHIFLPPVSGPTRSTFTSSVANLIRCSPPRVISCWNLSAESATARRTGNGHFGVERVGNVRACERRSGLWSMRRFPLSLGCRGRRLGMLAVGRRHLSPAGGWRRGLPCAAS